MRDGHGWCSREQEHRRALCMRDGHGWCSREQEHTRALSAGEGKSTTPLSLARVLWGASGGLARRVRVPWREGASLSPSPWLVYECRGERGGGQQSPGRCGGGACPAESAAGPRQPTSAAGRRRGQRTRHVQSWGARAAATCDGDIGSLHGWARGAGRVPATCHVRHRSPRAPWGERSARRVHSCSVRRAERPLASNPSGAHFL